jgi:hypothetical protein
MPEDGAVPAAVSAVDETNVVLSGVPANKTCAPFTNPLPVTASEIAPTLKVAGFTLAMAGMGFNKVILLVPVEFALTALTAVIVTVLVFGTAAGAA